MRLTGRKNVGLGTLAKGNRGYIAQGKYTSGLKHNYNICNMDRGTS